METLIVGACVFLLIGFAGVVAICEDWPPIRDRISTRIAEHRWQSIPDTFITCA